jgi:hypothetical protein
MTNIYEEAIAVIEPKRRISNSFVNSLHELEKHLMTKSTQKTFAVSNLDSVMSDNTTVFPCRVWRSI